MELATARRMAERLLATACPGTWAHCQGAALRAELLRPVLGDQTDLVAAAAELHDIGHCPDLHRTGFHPLDGAYHLRDAGADELTVLLVAHHSHSVFQARAHGLDRRLQAEFAQPPALLAAALTWCDMTSDADGRPTMLDRRLVGMQERHRDDPGWTKGHTARVPALYASVSYIDASLTAERRGELSSLSVARS